MRIIVLTASLLALVACGEPNNPEPAKEAAPEAAAQPLAPLASLTPHDLLLECAGAIIAQHNLDPRVDPHLDTPAENSLWTVIALMDKEPDLKTRWREASYEQGEAWKQRSAGDRAARAQQCIERFP